jgi:hypothetical protein
MEKQFYSERSGLEMDLLIHSHDVGCSPLVREEIPMTMQIAMPATKGRMVFASDTKIRLMEPEPPDLEMTKNPCRGTVHRSKISFSSKHDVAVGLSGANAEDADWARELADYFSDQPNLPDALTSFTQTWGNGLFQRNFPDHRQHNYPMCSLLVVSPRSPYCRFLKLRVNRESSALESNASLVNGNENLSAIFWLEYFKCYDKAHDLHIASRIAAFTILMGHELNEGGIGGLELWTYSEGWTRMPANEIENLQAEFQAFKDSVHSAVLR